MAFCVVALAAVQAGGSTPTPIYHIYQTALDLSPLQLTTVFAVYPLSLLLALLTVGSLSDHVGRRPVVFAAMLLSVLSMAAFLLADGFATLVAARILQGAATGAAASSLGAAMLDVDPSRGALINSTTAFSGTTAGALLASALVAYAPAPTRLAYAILLATFLALALCVRGLPETSRPRPGERHSLRPHLELPAHIRSAFWTVSPVNVAGWALGGFYLSLMPAVFRVATGTASPMLGGAVIALLTFAGAVAIVVVRGADARPTLIIGASALTVGTGLTMAGVHAANVAVLAFGTLVAGIGFGTSFFGAARTVLPLAKLHERAGLLSAFYVESYIAFSVPAVLISLFTRSLGLTLCTYLYGGFVMVLALMSLVATVVFGPAREGTDA